MLLDIGMLCSSSSVGSGMEGRGMRLCWPIFYRTHETHLIPLMVHISRCEIQYHIQQIDPTAHDIDQCEDTMLLMKINNRQE